MRLLIDMQGAQTASRYRGVGRYTMALVRAMVAGRGPDDQIGLLLNARLSASVFELRDEFEPLLGSPQLIVWDSPGPIAASAGNVAAARQAAAVLRQAAIDRYQPEVLLITSLFEGFIDDALVRVAPQLPTAVVLYDLIPWLNPGEYLDPSPLYAHYYREQFAELNKAARLLAISESSASEARRAMQIDEDKLTVISAGLDEVFEPEPPASLVRLLMDRYELQPDGYLLYVGGADERKNLHRLLEAYQQVAPEWRQGLPLVVVGRMPLHDELRLVQTCQRLGLQPHEVRFLGFVNDEHLSVLYRNTRALVFPSWHEGFGLPVLEAMSCGAPVLAARSSSVPEVLGEVDAYFDPFSVADMSRAITAVLRDASARRALGEHGRERASRFTWSRTAALALEACRELAAGSPGQAGATPDAAAALAACLNAWPAGRALADRYAQSLLLAQAQRTPRQLYVDISELVIRDVGTGIQRVTRGVLEALLREPPAGYEVIPVAASLERSGYRRVRVADGPQRFQPTEQPIEPQPADVFLGLDLQPAVVPAQRAAFDALHAIGVRIMFVVYDLLPIQMPWAFPEVTEPGYRQWLECISNYDGALCISQSVADQLSDWYARRPASSRSDRFLIRSFPLGSDIEASRPSRGLPPGATESLAQWRAAPTFLMVGTLEPRKCHQQVLDAFELRWQQGSNQQLLIVGRQGWKVDALLERVRRHPELGRRLWWLTGVSDEYLEQLYGVATGLILASLGEGYGLPIVEAMRRGLPVLARDLPVFHEVGGPSLRCFRGNEPEAIAAALASWEHDQAKGCLRRPEPTQTVTWQQSAQALLKHLLIPDSDRSDGPVLHPAP